MTRRGVPRAALLACAALLTNFYSSLLQAQAPAASGTYEVRKGEGLLAISSKLGYEAATRFQIVAGIYRANQEVFPDGNINVLKEGQVLKLPSREEVAAISAAEASRLWQTLVARRAPPPIASVKPAPLPEVAPKEPAGSVA